MSGTRRIDVCAVDALDDGEALKVEAGGLTLAVFKVAGCVYVTDDHCTHGPGSLSEGVLEGYQIECDFHQGCFDVRTGAVTAPPCLVPVRSYPVRVEGERVLIDAGPAARGAAAVAPGPAPAAAAAAGGGSPRIEIEGGGSFDCPADDSILRAALRAGHGFPYACNVGSCGTCRFELKQGAVEHLREDAPAWSARDRERGRWLGCQARPLTDCRIALRLDPQAVPQHPPARMRGRLTDVVALTHDISEFGFALDGPDAFRAGQYALLEPPGVRGGRAYSMCNLPGSGEWRFQIKRVPGGAATGALFGAMRPGDLVGIDGPYGHAYLREDQPRDLLLVAGGSGLSPMVSIARAAAASPALAERRVHFVYGGRQPRDICGEQALSALPGWGERLSYLAAISEPAADWRGATGYVHEVVKQRFGARLGELEIYFAGPPTMAQAMQSMLHAAGVPAERLHFDEFY